MKRLPFFILSFLLLPGILHAWQKDSIVKPAQTPLQNNNIKPAINDSVRQDSLNAVNIAGSINKTIDSSLYKNVLLTMKILENHPYFDFASKAAPPPYSIKEKHPGKEVYFYILTGILLLFAAFKTAFSKYFSDLINLFFRRSLKLRQLKQQVSQNSLPSLLFNILYVVAGGFYFSLMIRELGLNSALPYWQFFVYSIILIGFIYMGKYLILRFVGWVFHLKPLTDSYIFITFLVNKIIGIVLLPVIVIAALGSIELKTIVWTLSWLAVSGLYLYRFWLAFSLVIKEKAISVFHFILYVLAFELLPILMIYKGISILLVQIA